jgi:hypothetical protein
MRDSDGYARRFTKLRLAVIQTIAVTMLSFSQGRNLAAGKSINWKQILPESSRALLSLI